MRWEKKGLIFKPDGSKEWSKSHAQMPIVDKINIDRWRVYYSTRDKLNRSRIGYIDIDPNNPKKILKISNNPILELGKPGTFDDTGVMASWLLNFKEKKYLYYIGWMERKSIVPYHNSIGLAISNDGGKTYKKISEGPLFSSTINEPFFTGTSCVIVDNNKFKNWYLSCTGWINIKSIYEPLYHIKYAESKDGIQWVRKGEVAIDYKGINEGGIVKASVLREQNIYKMWYAYRNRSNFRNNIADSYRIGYAESSDGIKWIRKDHKAGISVSEKGWDSKMISYPHVVEYNGEKIMFYNGNGFGKSGFGYAVLK